MEEKKLLTVSIFAIVLYIPFVIFTGFVYTLCWKWFVVQTFGVDQISIPVALGLGAITKYVTRRTGNSELETQNITSKTLTIQVSSEIFSTIFLLLFCWVLTQFM